MKTLDYLHLDASAVSNVVASLQQISGITSKNRRNDVK